MRRKTVGLRARLGRPGKPAPRRDLVLLGQPNNPTGLWLDSERLVRLARARPGTWFVVDEAFAGFVEGCRSMAAGRMASPGTTSIVLRSLTKLYAIAGLRLGYAVAPAAAAERLRARLLPWSVNSLAQAAGLALLDEDDYVEQTVRYVAAPASRAGRTRWAASRASTSIPARPISSWCGSTGRTSTPPPWPSGSCAGGSPSAPSLPASTSTAGSSASPCGPPRRTRPSATRWRRS